MNQLSFRFIYLTMFLIFIFPFFPLASLANEAVEFKGIGKIISPKILTKLDTPDADVNIIVLLKGHRYYIESLDVDDVDAMEAIQEDIKKAQANVLSKLKAKDFVLRHQFDNISGFSGTVTLSGLKVLTEMEEVELIEEDIEVVAHLRQGIPLIHASQPRSLYDGTGISVAIVDTGIDYNHSKLGGGIFPNSKVIGGYDFGDMDSDPMDCQGHGTGVAGIAAGTQATGPGDYIGGVAHNAKLYGLKIISGCEGGSLSSTIAAAWDWAVSHKNDDPDNPIMIINTSFGGGYYTSSCDSAKPTLAIAATNAVNNGITVFVSSGNEGYCNAMAAPACISNAISVGAVYDAGIGSPGWCISSLSCIGELNYNCYDYRACFDISSSADYVTCYSNSANFLDIFSASNDAYTTDLLDGYFANFGGTSAASPYAAGAAAVLQHAAKVLTGSFLSPEDIKSKLVITGNSVTDTKSSVTKPRINLEAAIDTISPPKTYSLTINKAGTGTGTVSSQPTGIECGSTCSASFNSSAAVILTAAAATGSIFTGWSGACTGTSTCQVTMDSNVFVTVTFEQGEPNVWLDPGTLTILPNRTFDIEVHLNSGIQKLGVYQFDIDFDNSLINVDTLNETGIEEGTDGFITSVNVDNSAGTVKVNGYNFNGTGPGSDLEVLILHLKTLNVTLDAPVNTHIGLTVNYLADPENNDILPALGKGADVTITPVLCGDANNNGEINIGDALSIARYSVGLPEPDFIEAAADVDCSDSINIGDALNIARHSVDLPVTNWCCE